MIANPILRKEVLSSLRSRKAVAMQGMFLLVSALLVWWLWPAGGVQARGGEDAQMILQVLALGEVVMIALIAPAFTAASLTSERERNTLESLFASLVRPHEIALGKMLGSLVFLLLLVLCGTPALAMPMLLGGISVTQVLAVVGVLLLTAVYLGAIGLLVSTFMHRSYRAIIVTYGVLLGVCLVVALPAWPISGGMVRNAGLVGQWILGVLASLSPLEAMLAVVLPGSPYVPGPQSALPPIWQLYLVASGLVIVGTAAVILVRLRRPIAPPRPREKLRVIERGQVSARTFLFLVDPRKRKRMVQWWQNPVVIKEFRTRPMLQTQWLLRAVSFCLMTSILLMLLVPLAVGAYVSGRPEMFRPMCSAVAVLIVLLVALVGPAITAGTICADRETGVWDLLRISRVPSWRIVSGKFQASIIPLLLLTGAMVPSLFVLLYFRSGLLPQILDVLAVVGMTVLFVSTAGMFFSSLFSRTAVATAWTYGLVLVLGLLSLLVLLGEERFYRPFVRAVFLINPVATALAASGNDAMQRLTDFGTHLKIMGGASAAMFVVTVVRVFQLRQPDR